MFGVCGRRRVALGHCPGSDRLPVKCVVKTTLRFAHGFIPSGRIAVECCCGAVETMVHRSAVLASAVLCAGVVDAFVPVPGRAGVGLRALPAASALRRAEPALRPRAPAPRMSSAYGHDSDDTVLQRVEAIMEATSLQVVISYFEHAFVSEPATIPADMLEASLAAPAAEPPTDPCGDCETTELAVPGEGDGHASSAAMPPSVHPVELHADSEEGMFEVGETELREDPQGVLRRAQAMADVMGGVVVTPPVPPSEDAADVLARVDQMMDLHLDTDHAEYTCE